MYFTADDSTVEIDDQAIQSLLYTSTGVVVRHISNPHTAAEGQQRFSVIGDDGQIRRLGLETTGAAHASDPDQPYLLYAEKVDGELQVVVYDVVDDEEVARVPVGRTASDWFPVALDGDSAWVRDGYGGATYQIDWVAGSLEERGRTDVTRLADQRTALTAGGAVYGDGHPVVIDAVSGTEIWSDESLRGYTVLSPTGEHVLVVDEKAMDASMEPGGNGRYDIHVADIDTGEVVTLSTTAMASWSWTADGDLFSLTDEGVMTTCDPASGSCSEQEVPLPAHVPRECSTRTSGTGAGSAASSSCGGQMLDIVLAGQFRN